LPWRCWSTRPASRWSTTTGFSSRAKWRWPAATMPP
jgi:hypothetical protein